MLSEVKSFKFQCSAIVEKIQSAPSRPIDLLNAIHRSGLQEVYPNILTTFASVTVVVLFNIK